jgi:general stress protein 26
MKTHTQTDARLAHVAELIKDIPVAMLATIEADGSLASRPMAALEMDAGGALWFFTNLRSSKVEHLRVANLAFADVAQGTYVSLSGRGEIVTDRRHIERLWTESARPWFPDGPDSPDLALLRFVPEAADHWDAPSGRMARAFGMIASMVVGRPAGLGERGSHAGPSSGTTAGGVAS